MNITLINPPFEVQDSVGSSRSLSLVLNVIPPLGLGYLAAALETSGFCVQIIDFTLKHNRKTLLRQIASQNPAVIGITASTPIFASACDLTKVLRNLCPKALLVLGGAHVTAMPEPAMKSGYFDIGVIAEGEETFLALVKNLEEKGGGGLETIPGIIIKKDDRWILTPKREYAKNLDTLPFPSRHLLPPLSCYQPTPASYRRLPLGIIITSRGCPHQCTFCDRAVFGNVYRARSSQNVLAEVKEVVNKYGAREIRFFDDCFTLDKRRVYDICAGLRKSNIKIPWTCLTTVTSVDKDLLKEMAAAGCWQVLFGLESGDERMLARLCKGPCLEDNVNAVRWAKQAGLSVRADFIVGTPGETKESLQKTLAFTLNNRLDYAHFNKFVPYPGTELYKNLTGEGYRFDFNKPCSITDHESFAYIPPTLEKEYYENFLNYAHQKFYLRPGYMLKRLLSIRGWDEFIGQLKGFLSIVLLRRSRRKGGILKNEINQ